MKTFALLRKRAHHLEIKLQISISFILYFMHLYKLNSERMDAIEIIQIFGVWCRCRCVCITPVMLAPTHVLLHISKIMILLNELDKNAFLTLKNIVNGNLHTLKIAFVEHTQCFLFIFLFFHIKYIFGFKAQSQ